VVGAFSSMVFLFSLSFFTFLEALQTLCHVGHLDAMHRSFDVTLVAAAHFFVWIVVFFLVGGN